MKHHLLSAGIYLSAIVSLMACKSEETTTSMVPSKIIVTATVEVKADKAALFQTLVQSVITDSRAEPGCMSYTLLIDPSKPNQFFFFEEWKDAAAIDTHFATPHFKAFGAALDTLAVAPAQIKQFKVID